MPRPKLSPLSALLPQKGTATRPETISIASEQPGKQASKQAAIEPPRSPHSEVTQVASYKEGSRSAVSFRMTENLQERLRVYAFESRRSKQDVLDDALHEFLLRAGY